MAIIFWDFDGTLVYSNPLWSTTVFNSLKEVNPNIDVKFTDIRKCMATGFTWHTPDEDYSNLIGDKWWEFMNRKISDDYISLGVDADVAQKAASLVRKNIKNVESYTLYPNTFEALEKSLKMGHKNVLLSNNYPDLIEVLDKLELTKYFDRIIVSANYGYDKPRKELFDIAKSLYPNEEYIMVGDSITADIVGGNNAGMKTVLVHKGYEEKADFCTENLTEIFEFI